MRQIAEDFDRDLQSVYSLMDFDRLILDFAILQLEKLLSLFEKQCLNIPLSKTKKALGALRDIRTNESTKLVYETIYNQCVVLQVSYFSATLEDIFKYCVTSALKRGLLPELAKQEVRVTIADLRRLADDPEGSAGDLIVAHNNISFQDMGSVRRSFGKLLGYEPERTEAVHNIIVGQAARHIIVHIGGLINQKFLKQIADAVPRSLKQEVPKTGRIAFLPDEIRILGDSMKQYIATILENLAAFQIEDDPTQG